MYDINSRMTYSTFTFIFTNYSIPRATWPESSARAGVACYTGFRWGSGSPIKWLYWLTRCGPQPLQRISASWYRPMNHLGLCAHPNSNTTLLVVPHIHTELAHRAFSVAAPSTWNSLPTDIRLCENILIKRAPFSFNFVRCPCDVFDMTVSPQYIVTYLLTYLLENPSVQTHLVLMCCHKHLCIFGPKGAIKIHYYSFMYYYYCISV